MSPGNVEDNKERNLVGTDSTHSAISVVNALATGSGSAIGIKLYATVFAKLHRKSTSKRHGLILRSDFKDRHGLVQTCGGETLNFLKENISQGYTLSFSVQSEIPVAVGLKSSSAISIACVRSVCALFQRKITSRELLDISCKASKKCGASITGAYDDAAACLLGGLVLTDNLNFKLLSHRSLEKSLGKIVLIRIPNGKKRYTSSVDVSSYAPFKKESERAFESARKGMIPQAMLINSLIQCRALGYSFEPVSSAIEEGATASGLSGKGPAVSALCKTERVARRIEKRWNDEESKMPLKIIRTQIVQPIVGSRS